MVRNGRNGIRIYTEKPFMEAYFIRWAEWKVQLRKYGYSLRIRNHTVKTKYVELYEIENSMIYSQEGEKTGMNANKTMQLSDVVSCSAAVTAFYDQYRGKIVDIETTAQRIDILSAMQQDFEKEVRQNPQDRNELSSVYELLKMKCWEV